MGDRPILILGATGGFGGAVLAQALDRGMPVRALARNAHEARGRLGAPVGLEWVTGDGRDAAAVLRAAQGARAVVHGIDVAPGDRAAVLPAIAANVADAARAAGIPVIFPGSVHPLGRGSGQPFGPDATSAPVGARGRAEAAVIARLADGGDLLVVRAGDHFGPGAASGPGAALFGAVRAGRAPILAGNPGLAHLWAFLPDLARLALDLLDRGWQGETVAHGPSVIVAPGDFAGMIARAAGHPGLGLRRQPWWLVRLRALADPAARDLLEQRYLWDDGVMLEERLPADFVPTPLDQAIALTLRDRRSPP